MARNYFFRNWNQSFTVSILIFLELYSKTDLFLLIRPYFDHSKSQTTLNQTSLTKVEANALSRAVVKALRENGASNDDNSDDPRSDLDTKYVSVPFLFAQTCIDIYPLTYQFYYLLFLNVYTGINISTK